ncbi:hypothetical protein LZ30DRAFT_334298 [Colletotrichum cereale]|nr:hypothetical protein LZ30DRAFT_334298 [Colletotrichum cereale]
MGYGKEGELVVSAGFEGFCAVPSLLRTGPTFRSEASTPAYTQRRISCPLTSSQRGHAGSSSMDLYLQGHFSPCLFSLTLHHPPPIPFPHFGPSVLPVLAARRGTINNNHLCSLPQTTSTVFLVSSAPFPFLNHRQSRQPEESLHDILQMTLTTFVCHSRRNVGNKILPAETAVIMHDQI